MAILLIVLDVAAMSPAFAADSASVPAPPAQTDDRNDDDDEEDNWIFDAGPYSENPKTGQRTWQYAKEKPAYRDPLGGYSTVPFYYGGDPFFLPSTDSLFFMNTPDPFYTEPTGYPYFYNGPFGADRYFYGIGAAVNNP
ncbi:MAG: hypothetical protein IT426_17935 [Pirellulales bacterium]|nr:hypothetical protein [Pirellulales bacterium]